jgi:hypothetical protein
MTAVWKVTSVELFTKHTVGVVIVPYKLKVGCVHPVACTRLGSGFPSNATLPEDGHKTETCSGY